MSAKSRWDKLDAARSGVLERGREAAHLTVPSLMPPQGHTETSRLSQPYQSLGARGLNNLASKLTLSMMPTGSAFFRLTMDDEVAAEVADQTAVQEALQEIENRASKRVERSNLRVAVNMALKLLACTGNALMYMPSSGGARVFRLTQYVVVRDAMGNWREIVIKEDVHPLTLSEEIRTACQVQLEEDNDENIAVYTHAKVNAKGKVEYHQEINEIIVPGSEGRSSLEESPYIPLRWVAIENENYGRGLVEEYLGDLRSLEGLSKSVVQFAAAAAKVVFLERPNSSTDIEALEEAESGEFVTGNPEDIHVLQIQKYPDFQVAKQTIDELTLRLSHAFLLSTGTVRNAERVTAEEIRMQAQELEDVLGGVYTVLSQELQLPIVRRLLVQMRKAGEIPATPGVQPTIITGFDALGRGHELNKLRAYLADLAGVLQSPAIQVLSPERLAAELAVKHNVDIRALQKTPEEVEAEQAQQMGAQVLDKAAGPVAGAVAKGMTQQ